MPMTALSVVGASWRLKAADRARLATELLPWALHAGSRSADLMCLYYERHFEARARARPAPMCMRAWSMRMCGSGGAEALSQRNEGRKEASHVLQPPRGDQVVR